MHGGGGRLHQLLGVLKGEAARQGQREVGEVTRAGAAHASLLHGQHAFDALHFAHQAAPRFGGNFIHERAHGFMAQTERHAQDHDRDDDGGDRIGVAQPGDAETRAKPCGAEAGEHGQRGPDVGGKMEGVGGQRGRAGALGHGAQLARAPEIDADGGDQHQHRPEGVAQLDGVKKMRCMASQTIHAQETAMRPASVKAERFSNFAVAVGVVFVGGLVADVDGEKSERGSRRDRGRSAQRQRARRASRRAGRRRA